MRCPNTIKSGSLRCITFKGAYTPSTFQAAEYCLSRYHVKCPFYLGYHAGKLDLNELKGTCTL
jgi:hypothetical protein